MEITQNANQSFEIPKDLLEVGLLKFEILATGLRVSKAAKKLVNSAKKPIRTRSGASGGLDIILPKNVYVNCPVNEKFSKNSHLILDYEEDTLVIKRDQQKLCEAELQPIPEYYNLVTSDGIQMDNIGQLCSGDRFCYGMTGPYCYFWKHEYQCKFCTIALNKKSDFSQKTIDQLLETLSRAVEDSAIPVKHVLLGGGTPNIEDMGALLATELCTAIKKRFNLSCYVMIAAPSSNKYIDMMIQAQVDELGMNLEFFSDAAWEKYIPGKAKFIGKKRYLEALEYSVTHLGALKTRSILVVGLEDPEFTIAGAEKLSSMGVMPILSPFRPLEGSELENVPGFDYKTYFDIYIEVHKTAMKYGVPTGPTCIPCQNNTLTLPIPGDIYRFY